MTNGLLAVITGASSGIGEAFARQLAARGYDLLLVARREDRLKSLAKEIVTVQRVAVDVMAADLVTDEGRARVAERIRDSRNLGLLVNNAGFGMTPGFFHAASLEVQDQ